MGSIGRYIFRNTLGAFVAVTACLTALIWVTQALREIDLMTSQGQTALLFLQITTLIIPNLLVLLSPVALLIAVVYVLNKLGNDSEIIVMNASGMSPWHLFRPFLAVAAVVSVFLFIVSAYIAPRSLNMLRTWSMEVRTDLVTFIIRPGVFANVQKGVTFHIRDRSNTGQLLGVLIDDKRNPKEPVTILAERGEILKNETDNFLILQGGTVQRHTVGEAEPTIVEFDRYAIDLSQFTPNANLTQSARERYLWDLIWPDPDDRLTKSQPGQIRGELLDRAVTPLYPFVFVLVAYAYLGAPRTTRQSRNLSLVGCIVAVMTLRFVAFMSMNVAVNALWIVPVLFLVLCLATGASIWAIDRGVIIEPPAFITNAVTAIQERFAPRVATA